MIRIVLFLLFNLCAGVYADDAFAASNNTVIGNALCTTAGWFTGNLGIGLETISVLIFGMLALLGKISWGMAVIDAVAVAGLHSAGIIVESLDAGAPVGC